MTSASAARAAAFALVTLVALVAPPLPVLTARAASKPKPPPPRYTFAGIPWLLPADSVRARLTPRGYEPVASASDSTQSVFRGTLFEHDAVVTGQYDDQRRLVRWVVLITARGDAYKWPDMKGVFDEVAQESETRYGPPRTVTEKYGFPYERGDGRTDEALRDGLLNLRWVWESKSGDRLAVSMDQNVSVVLTYECQEWRAFESRRRSKRAADL